jgi:SPOR domain
MSSTFTTRVRRPGADAAPAPGESAGRARRVWSVLPICAGLAVFGAIVWLAYQDASLGPPVGEPPLIKAAAEPIKLPPEQVQEPTLAAEQGGAVGRLWSDAEQDDQPERLLPPPEEPLSPPITEAPASAGQTLEGRTAQPTSEPAALTNEPATAAATEADRADGDAGVAPSPAAPADAPDAAAVQSPTDESLQEAEAALDRLLAEVTALPEDADAPGPTTAEPAADPAASERNAAREESPAAKPAATAAAPATPERAAPASPERAVPATPERAVPARPAQKPASGAPVATSRTTTEVRPAGARAGAPASDVQAPRRSTETAALAGAGAPIATPPVVPEGEFRIQLAAVRGEADAQRAWDLFMGDLGPVLSDIKPIFERADTANGVFYRVQIGPFASQGAAESLCEELKQRNASCFVIRR